MFDRDFRRKLSQKLRERLEAGPGNTPKPASGAEEPVREITVPGGLAWVAPPLLPEQPLSLAEFMGGRELTLDSGHLLVVEGYGKRVLEELALTRLKLASHELARALEGGPLVIFDLETCGFGGCPVFLVGLLECDGDQLELVQYLAEDLDQEAALLEASLGRLARAGGLVSYNGRAFDLPFLKERAAYHQQDFSPLGHHFDLLPIARKRLGKSVPNHKLQTLETCLLGRGRQGDVPGAEIADFYYQYAETRDLAALVPIMAHNAFDLVSLAQILELLAGD